MEWGVETMHWLLDVRYREDYFRAQNENIQKNMNMSRKLALNLAGVYKNKHAKKIPLSHIMFDCLMDPHHLLIVLGKNFSSVISECIFFRTVFIQTRRVKPDCGFR